MDNCRISRVLVFMPLSHVLGIRYNEAVMWPFKHKKTKGESERHGPLCTRYGSTNTRLIVYHGTDHPDYIRIWRGQRALTYRCLDCGFDFYAEEPQEGTTDEVMRDDQLIDDEEALCAAEEEIERQIEENDRRTY